MSRLLRIINAVIFFVAFLLLLLVSVSLPVANSLKWFTLRGDFSIATFARAYGQISFGMWGWCTSDLVAEGPFGLSTRVDGECSEAKLGWEIDSRLVDLLRLDSLQNAVSDTLTAGLVLNPIACGLVFLALIFAIWDVLSKSRAPATLGWIVGGVAWLLTLVAWIFDLIAYTLIKGNIEGIDDGFHVTTGATIWMTLVAWILIFVAQGFFTWELYTSRKRGTNDDIPLKERPPTNNAV